MRAKRPGPAVTAKSKDTCKARNCRRKAVVERIYCSAQCAPFGTWKDNLDLAMESQERLKRLEKEYENFDDDGMIIVK